MSHDQRLFIGIMSGTSLDGIDCVIVNFNDASLELIESHHQDFSADLRQKLLTLCQKPEISLKELGCLDTQLGEAYSQAVLNLLDKAQVKANQITAIGNHGQTVYHYPRGEYPFTMQIGNAAVIAARTNIPVIADFRSADIAHGGQGAPLVPAFHAAYFAKAKQNIAVINIGGISNVTFISDDKVLGFDMGPGNVLMDAWIQHHKNQNYDKNGDWAASGKPNSNLLKHLLDETFFAKQPPKSTGRELFNLAWLEHKLSNFGSLKPEVVQATLLELSAQGIQKGLDLLNTKIDAIYLCGGGAFNTTLFNRIQALNHDTHVATTSELGVDPSWVESIAFAWLAKQTIDQHTGNLPIVTGAKRPCILGAYYQA